MKLILFRHCETTFNKTHKFTGTLDARLTSLGRKQASELCTHLKRESADIIFSSPLHRCLETAQIVRGKKDIVIVADQNLRERSYGDLQGMSHARYKREHGEEALHFIRRNYDVAPSNGESLKDVERRVVAWYKRLLKCKYDRVWVCMHGNVLRMLRKHLEQLSVRETLNLEHPYNVVYEYDVKL